jgi:hypothetical protein
MRGAASTFRRAINAAPLNRPPVRRSPFRSQSAVAGMCPAAPLPALLRPPGFLCVEALGGRCLIARPSHHDLVGEIDKRKSAARSQNLHASERIADEALRGLWTVMPQIAGGGSTLPGR